MFALAASRRPQVQGSWSADLTTRSGVRLHVRPGQIADVTLLGELFAHVSAADLRFRFMGTIKKLSEDQLRALLDPNEGMTTYIAFAEDGRPVACCTLAEDPGGQSAEVALSVRSGWKRRGVSWTLLEHVLACAAARGLRRIDSIESADDREAINLQREMGFVARLHSAEPMEVQMSKFVEPR